MRRIHSSNLPRNIRPSTVVTFALTLVLCVTYLYVDDRIDYRLRISLVFAILMMAVATAYMLNEDERGGSRRQPLVPEPVIPVDVALALNLADPSAKVVALVTASADQLPREHGGFLVGNPPIGPLSDTAVTIPQQAMLSPQPSQVFVYCDEHDTLHLFAFGELALVPGNMDELLTIADYHYGYPPLTINP